jgi:hypothetical protein
MNDPKAVRPLAVPQLQRQQPQPDRDEIDRIARRVSDITEQERRLVKALASGRIDEGLVIEELDELKRQRGVLEGRLRELQPRTSAASPVPEAQLFGRACRAASDFLDKASPEDRALALEALQIVICATPTEAVVQRVVPIGPDAYCHANNHPDARFSVINRAWGSGCPSRSPLLCAEMPIHLSQ